MPPTGDRTHATRDPERVRAPSSSPPAPGTATDRILALQAGAGNRAVSGLLARDPAKPAPADAKAPQVTGPRVDMPSVGVIPIESVQMTQRPPRQQRQGSAAPQPLTEFTITSRSGEHSPKLMLASVSGKPETVSVWIFGGTMLRITEAMVASYTLSPGREGEPPVEVWTLQGVKVEFEKAKEEEK